MDDAPCLSPMLQKNLCRSGGVGFFVGDADRFEVEGGGRGGGQRWCIKIL